MCFIFAVQPRGITTNIAEQPTGASSNMLTGIEFIINIFFCRPGSPYSCLLNCFGLWAWTAVTNSLSHDDCL